MRLPVMLKTAMLSFLASAPLSAGEINFVYPSEGASLPALTKTFIFGNISPATAPFTINGEKIEVYSNGGFIANLPVAGGDFIFKGQLDDGTTAQRHVTIKINPEPRPSTGTLSLEFTSGSADSEILAGDYIRISACGTPGREAVFSLGKLLDDSPLSEIPAGSGRYYGIYRVKPGDQGAEFYPSARFKAGLFARGAAARAKGKIRVLKAPVMVETSTDAVVLKDSPDGGSMMFLPKGVKLVSEGRSNGMRRIYLSPDLEGWVEDAKVLPVAGAPYPFGSVTETSTIRLKKTDFGSSASLGIYDKVPFMAEELENGLRLTLYYTNLHTNYVIYDDADTLVKNVSFRQVALNIAQIDLETAPGALWGYNVFYSTAAKGLQVDLRAAPKPALTWPKPLSGLTIVLDPGHSVYYKCPGDKRVPMKDIAYEAVPKDCSLDGAVGPMKTFEINVNLGIALKLKDSLSALGAEVRLTRNGDENVELADRPRLAKELGGDLFISLHNNAIGDGEDPFLQPRGFTVYYYQRHSRALADALHSAYLKNIALPDEGLRYGDYLVVRNTWMPAALIESAYMILPRQEELVNDPAFQEKLAGAAAEGILEYFGAPHRPEPKKENK